MTALEPEASDIKRWRRYLANERAEAALYRDIAAQRSGEEREILLALAEAEKRHEQHWLDLLGDRAELGISSDLRTRFLGFCARHFGFVFILALAQRAESRSPYENDADATPQMAADEQIHEEVIRALAERGRQQLSGSFRAAVFGINDGLVSNLALVLGVSASGLSHDAVLLTGISGLLAGALSMGAGEYVSVRSQRELLEASRPNLATTKVLPQLDIDANELALVYRARGMESDEAYQLAREKLDSLSEHQSEAELPPNKTESETDAYTAIGTGWSVAFSSFCFFAIGALIPILPYLVGARGFYALVIAVVLVGLVLMVTGAIVGLLSGESPWKRALRQLGIAYSAAAITYALGYVFGAALG